MSSRGLSKPKATSDAALRKLAGTYHWHVCATATCRTVYYCTCSAPQTDRPCQRCRHPERDRPEWDRNRDREPRPCCSDDKNLKLVTDTDTIAGYRLAGPGPWWQCQVCFLSHGRKPQR